MTIHLESITNPDLIKKAIKIDNLFVHLIHGSVDDWNPDFNLMQYFYVYRNNLPFGLIAIERFCSNGVAIHGGVFKTCRHLETEKIFRLIVDLIKEKTNKVTVAYTTIDNIPCQKMMKKAGFVEKCVIRNASLLGDVVIFGENE